MFDEVNKNDNIPFVNKVMSRLTQQFISLAIVAMVLPASSQTRKYSNEYTTLGAGARSFGLGQAVVGSVCDVTAAYWNPAGLAHLPHNYDLGLMHSEYFAGIAKYDYGAAAVRQQSSDGVFALSVLRFGIDDIPNTTDLKDQNGTIDYSRISKFSVADYAFLLSYGKKLANSNLSFGGSAKIIYRNYGKFAQGYGFGIDLGMQYRPGKWLIGLTARDITTTFTTWSNNPDELMIVIADSVFNTAPENSSEIRRPSLLAGISRRFVIKEVYGIMVEVDAEITTDGRRNVLVSGDPFSINPYAGLEFDYKNLLYLRAGVTNIQQKTDFKEKKFYSLQPNAGLGIAWKGLRVDYSLANLGDLEGAMYSHILSLQFGFDALKRN